MLTGRLATAGLVFLIALCIAFPAHADGLKDPGDGGVVCGPQGCQIDVGTPGSPGGNNGGGNGGGGGGGDGPVNNCAYTTATVPADRAAELGHPLDGPGRWYWRTCVNPVTGSVDSFTSLVWLASPPPMISPVVLAQRARSTLRPPPVAVSINPHPITLVRMPVWLAASSGWRQVSQTASVPGMAVTATATPIRTTWWMGEGSTVTCTNPGTVYQPGVHNPEAASPTCGFTYLHPTNGFVTVTAMVTYRVAWSGGGQSGTAGDITATSSTAIRVEESQTVITR